LEDTSVDGRIVLKCIFRNWEDGVHGLIDLTQDRLRWGPLVNVVMNFPGP
jgi:hypothetical protein